MSLQEAKPGTHRGREPDDQGGLPSTRPPETGRRTVSTRHRRSKALAAAGWGPGRGFGPRARSPGLCAGAKGPAPLLNPGWCGGAQTPAGLSQDLRDQRFTGGNSWTSPSHLPQPYLTSQLPQASCFDLVFEVKQQSRDRNSLLINLTGFCRKGGPMREGFKWSLASARTVGGGDKHLLLSDSIERLAP